MRKINTGPRNNFFLGLYLHVPFCSTTCDFCAFYQERPSKKGFELLFSGLEKEFELFPGNRSFSTVFIGGGTPGVLQPSQIRRLGQLINSMNLMDGVEWSMEIAPAEITSEKLEVISEIGVNRISLGVQTFNSKLMKELGRIHDVDQAVRAYHMIREAGFSSVNLDLIFGAPSQTLKEWENDLIRAVELEPDHLSTYCLTFEEDTALYLRMAKGKINLDSEKEAAYYERAWDFLPRHGYSQYEVSNFAKPGFACRHNLNTWRMNEWLGFGPSASSQYAGMRRKNPSNLEHWSAQLIDNNLVEYEEFESLCELDFARDAILFGIRMNEGVNFEFIASRFELPIGVFDPAMQFFQNLQKEGLCEIKESCIRLSDRGRILADGIASELPDLKGTVVSEQSVL